MRVVASPSSFPHRLAYRTMSRAVAVPVTPSVLTWAVKESGYTHDELAAAVRVPPDEIRSWEAGEHQPNLTQLRALSGKLKRPMAAFLLPRPPRQATPALEFRRAPGEARSQLNADERRMVRAAARLQRVLSWINRELHRPPVLLARVGTRGSAETAARETLDALRAMAAERQTWRSSSAAFHWWRLKLEESGVFVLMLPLGADGCRGFSLWDDYAPLIAVNTAWSPEARAFTLFHEYGHLITRTNSVCLEGVGRTQVQSDAVERWCEQFAAAVILPLEQVQHALATHGWGHGVDDVNMVRTIAREFKASLRATALRLIELNVATWELYASLPAAVDRKRPGGGGAGRDRVQVRSDQYGDRAIGLFAEALRQDVVGRGDVLDYLDVPPHALAAVSAAGSASTEPE